jgi:DUF1680 family protein
MLWVKAAGFLTILLGWMAMNSGPQADAVVEVVERPPAGGQEAQYTATRAPLQPVPLLKLPIGAIEPRGWLRKQLQLQAAGFHGHLTEISPFLNKQNNAWLDPLGRGDHGWEEVPYWLRGFSNCAYLLRDERMLSEARVWIEAAFRSQKEDGWFGPDEGRTGIATDLKGRDDLWPNMIMLTTLENYYEYSGDPRVLSLMERYFAYLRSVPAERFLLGYWPKMRGGDLLWSVLWLYNRTGRPELLELADKVHRHTARWDEGIASWHNVNIAQGFAEPAVYWLRSGDPRHLQAAYRNYETVMAWFGQMPGGMCASDENCRPGYEDPRQAVETCGMAEMMLSTEKLLCITGDPIWADRNEDVASTPCPRLSRQT